MTDATQPRPLPVRTAHIDFTGDYEGWWVDMWINPPSYLLTDLDGGLTNQHAALAELIRASNIADQSGALVDFHAEDVWDKTIPWDVVPMLRASYIAKLQERTQLPKASATPSANTS